MIHNILRYFLTFLSFPHNLRNEKISYRQKVLINETYNLSNKKKLSYNKKLKTHTIFSTEIIKLIKKKKLKDFLKQPFIQKMFFVHNKFHIIFLLIHLYFSKNWSYWKKLIKENTVGGPIPFFCYKQSSGNRIRQVYHLKKFNDISLINLKKIKNVIEIGGGYGCMASIFKRINKKVNYYIFDTKEVCMLQYYYLNSLNINTSLELGNKSVNLLYDINDFKKLSQKNLKDTLVISNWALSEMPISLREKISPIISKYDYILISFQTNFEKINNNIYFRKYSETLKRFFKTYFVEIKSMNYFKLNKHYYFFGIKNK